MTNDHLIQINVNTHDYEEPKGKISYQRVIELAYSDFAQFPNATYTITYERGNSEKPQGTLTKGATVEIVKGMRFRVKRTGES